MGFLANLKNRFRSESAGYETAGTGGRSRRWNPANLGPNAALDYSADKLRAQSRDMVRKNTLAASAVERIVSNTVGTGIKPQIPDEATADLFAAWTDEADAHGVLDFYGLQAQAMAAIVTAGECFVRLRARRPQDGLTVPLQVELLESEFVPMAKNETLSNGNTVRNGIEFDKNLRSKRVAYWMHRRHPGDNATSFDDNAPVRVAASEVLHLYLPLRPGQLRGEPWMARALSRLLDLDQYDKAELTRKKVAAMFAGFIRRATPADMTIEELAAIWGEADEEGGVGQVTLEAGTMQTLAPGEDVEFSNPSDVGAMYEVFMRQQQRNIAASLGVLYEQLTGDFSQVNDRTWRAAVSEFRRRCSAWQHQLMVFQFCRPIWTRWALLGQLAGVVSRAIDPLKPVVWTPQRWDYINPVQDIEAMEAEVRAGFKSRTAIVSERGDDAAKVDAEIAADNERAKSLDLILTSDPRHEIKAAAPQPGEPNDEGGPNPNGKNAQSGEGGN